MPRPLESPAMDYKSLVTIFKDEYKKAGYDEYYPNAKDWGCAKVLAKMGMLQASSIVAYFFYLHKTHPRYKSAPLTVSCCCYNRNDIYKLLLDTGLKTQDELKENLDDF